MKKFLKIFFSLILILIIAVVAGGYYFIKTFDLNEYKGRIEALVEEHLGRKLTMAGDAKLGISLIPTLEIDDVTLSNPEWAANPAMLSFKNIKIQVSILPLFKKQIVIGKVSLIGPAIFLEKDTDGKVNWDFSNKEKTKVETVATNDEAVIEQKMEAVAENPALALLAGLAVEKVSIEKGNVQFNDKISGKVTNVDINKITLAAASPDDKIDINFDVALDGEPIKGSLNLGSVNTFVAGGDYPVNLAVNAFRADLTALGTVANLMEEPSFDFAVTGRNPKGNFGAPETDFKIALKGDVSKVNVGIDFLSVAKNIIKGEMFADVSGKVPYIKANLASDLIDLTSFKETKTAFVMPSLISSAEASQLVPDEAIPYDLMKLLDADIILNVKKLIVQEGMDADNVSLNTSLKDGLLKMQPLSLKFGGGDINIASLVNAANRQVEINAVSKQMLLQNLHKEFVTTDDNNFGVLDGGAVDIKINLTTTGDTYRQLVQRLDGQMVVIIDKTRFRTGKLNFFASEFISNLLKAINMGKLTKPELDLNCGVVRADFKNGKADFPSGIAFDMNQVNLVSSGRINLVNDNVDFSLRPFAGKIKDINIAQALTSFIAIKGTVTEPKITIDNKQALKTAVGVAVNAPVFIGGSMVLGSDEAPCYTALKGTPFEERFPKPTGIKPATQDATNDAVSAVKQQVKDVKKNVKAEINNAKDTAKTLLNSFKAPKESAPAEVQAPEPATIPEPASIPVPETTPELPSEE